MATSDNDRDLWLQEDLYTLCLLSKPKLYSWVTINTALAQSTCTCNHSITLHVRNVNCLTLNITRSNNSTIKVCYMAPSWPPQYITITNSLINTQLSSLTSQFVTSAHKYFLYYLVSSSQNNKYLLVSL